MQRTFWRALVLAFFIISVRSGVADAAKPRKDHCVILVSIDGLAGFYLDDPQAHMPTLRKLAIEGARADGLVCSFPTVTWPNHTTLVTGVTPAKHGVIGNNYLDRETGKTVPLIPDPLLDKDEVVKTPTIYDVAHQAGLTTSAIIWPATRNAKTLHFTVPDMKGNDSWQNFGTTKWLDELRAIGLPVDRYGPWVDSPSGGVQRDWLYVRMAAQLLKEHLPNLLLIHLVEADHAQHKFGPRSGDAYWSVSYCDDRIRDLVDAIEASPMRDQTTLIIASDHGFFPITRDILPNVVLRKRELLGEGKQTAICVPQGGGCAVYILDDARRVDLIKQLSTDFAAVEGVQAVFTPDQFGAIGQPTREQDPHGADLWLAAESGYSFSGTQTGDDLVVPRSAPAGTHGFLPDQPDMLGTLVLHGAGIRQATRLGKVQSIDVAPTMARLLGVGIPGADGKPLTQAFSE